ncbi:MAG: hypothetical protein FWF15_01315 [Oscillospiraceae bacterium]|nr:hypothetical protein [Oscillospiraceae bacterium]
MNNYKSAGILFTVFFYIIIVAMIAGSTLFALSGNENKSIFGYRFYTVLSERNVRVLRTDQLNGYYYSFIDKQAGGE